MQPHTFTKDLQYISDMQNPSYKKKWFNIDINITEHCSMNCSYCMELDNTPSPKQNISSQQIDNIKQKLDELLESVWFNKLYQGINIGLWGGEPSLNKPVIEKLVASIQNDNRYRIYVFTNGYKIDYLLDLASRYREIRINGAPKIYIQISYDGQPVQQMKRTLLAKQESSLQVRDTIIQAASLQIPFSIKSTITPDTFMYLYETYTDIKKLILQTKMQMLYKPTIEYYNLAQYANKLPQYIDDLEKNLLKIAAEELQSTQKYQKRFFSWFTYKKALCSAGENLLAIDIDGSVYKCHGCFYTQHKEHHLVSTITRKTFVDDIINCHYAHKTTQQEPPQCKNCYATFCLRCNAVAYKHSTQNGYFNRWNDLASQPTLCTLYRKIGEISYAFNNSLPENK